VWHTIQYAAGTPHMDVSGCSTVSSRRLGPSPHIADARLRTTLAWPWAVYSSPTGNAPGGKVQLIFGMFIPWHYQDPCHRTALRAIGHAIEIG
jgi:hypothetical protein